MIERTTKKDYYTPKLEIQPTWVISRGIGLPIGATGSANPFGDFMDAPTEQQ